MHVLQAHSAYRGLGGEDVVVEREANLLRQAGHRVSQYMAPNPSTSGATMLALAGSVWNPVSFLAGFGHRGEDKPDVAHVHNTWFALSPSVVSGLRRAGIPVVVTLHNYRLTCINGLLYRDGAPCTECLGSSPLRGIRYRCYRSSSALSLLAATSVGVNRLLGTWDRQVSLFAVMTEFARQTFVDAGFPADRIVVKPHFVFDPGPRTAPPSASSTVLYVGRLAEEKGLVTLLDAWEAASPQGLQLLVVGDGPLRGFLEERRSSSVTLAGSRTPAEVTRLMLDSRALVFSSQWYETFGLVVSEALAAGLPVLASDLGGMAEVLSDLGGDWLVSATRVDAWVDKIRGLADVSAVDRAGVTARASYESRYSPGIGLENLEALYRRAIDSDLAQ